MKHGYDYTKQSVNPAVGTQVMTMMTMCHVPIRWQTGAWHHPSSSSAVGRPIVVTGVNTGLITLRSCPLFQIGTSIIIVLIIFISDKYNWVRCACSINSLPSGVQSRIWAGIRGCTLISISYFDLFWTQYHMWYPWDIFWRPPYPISMDNNIQVQFNKRKWTLINVGQGERGIFLKIWSKDT